jgi:hypothetical protein
MPFSGVFGSGKVAGGWAVGYEPRRRFIAITATFAAITLLGGVAAALSRDGGGEVAATAEASVSAGSLSDPTAGAPPLTSEAALAPVSTAPSTTEAPTTVPPTAPVTQPSPSSTAAVSSTGLTTTSTSAADGEIYGFVRVNGIPAPGASMLLEGPGGERRTQTDLRGYYAFERLAPGEYSVIQYSVFIPAPCPPVADACVGPASRMERHAVLLGPGDSVQDDWSTSLSVT